jgi:uncharacterized membrane protein YfcA
VIIELGLVGVLVGAMSGFFGIGGGTILIPILLAIGFDIKSAIGISVVQMAFTSIFGSYLNYKKGSLRLDEGLFVGVGGFVGGFMGAKLTQILSENLLQYMFLAILLFSLYRLATSKNHHEDTQSKSIHKGLLFVIGVMIGVFSISLGIGGSIILTPILVGILHYHIKKAVSAGLFFVVFSSLAGMIGKLLDGSIDFSDGLIVAFASLAGVAIGIGIKDYIKDTHHKQAILVLYIVSTIILINKMFF